MAEKRDTSAEHLTFSQRHRYEPLPKTMRLEELSGDLRREIWNRMRGFLSVFREDKFIGEDTFRDEKITGFIEYVLGKLFKLPQDEIQSDYENAMSQFKEIIEKAKFNKVLDLIEIVANSDSPNGVTVTGNTIAQNEYPLEFIVQRNEFILAISDQFNRHAAPYWLDISQRPCQFFPRSCREQGEATQQAIKTIRESGMEGASVHLRQAAQHINAQQFADSVESSIEAVESVARRIAPRSRTLGEALKNLEKKGLLTNSQLKTGFEKIYAYTNTEEGVRHSLVFKDSSDVGIDEAMFMFGACASFAAYLVNKHRQMNQQQDGAQ